MSNSTKHKRRDAGEGGDEERPKTVGDAVRQHSQKPTHSLRAYRECNVVAQENMFRERVRKEMEEARRWEGRWSFMRGDVVGNVRPHTAPARATRWDFFEERSSPALPLTNQGDIGSRVRKPSAAVQKMRRLDMYGRRPRLQSDVAKVNFS